MDDLDHPLGGFISEHPYGENVRWEAANDIFHPGRDDLTARRSQDETHRVGAQSGGQQSVVGGRYAADLDEHWFQNYRLNSSIDGFCARSAGNG